MLTVDDFESLSELKNGARQDQLSKDSEFRDFGQQEKITRNHLEFST